MNNLKQILVLLTGGLLTLNTFAAETTDRPIHVLYLGPVEADVLVREAVALAAAGRARTTFICPANFGAGSDLLRSSHQVTNLTDAYLKHFDAVVQVMPDGDISAAQRKMLDSFKSAGNALLKYTERPTDAVLREAS